MYLVLTVARWDTKVNQYNQHKTKVSLLLMGQCTTNMKRTSERNVNYHAVLRAVIDLLSCDDVNAK